MLPLSPMQFCWICGTAVTPETRIRDAHGYFVHRRCHAAREALAIESGKFRHENVDSRSSISATNKPMVLNSDHAA